MYLYNSIKTKTLHEFGIIYNMEIKVFDRIEKKYLITKAEKNKIKRIVQKHLSRDKYYKSKVFNLYFDDDNYNLINESIDWTDFKYKIRARSYEGYDRVFLELKTKIRAPENNLGYKRRVMITHDDFKQLIDKKRSLKSLVEQSSESPYDIQIAKEIDYLIAKNNLKPKILVIYNRESYKNDDDLRITFDENLKFRHNNLSLNSRKNDKIYFKDNRKIIMEVKARGALPLWFVKTLSESKVYPERFSKVGNVYQELRKELNV